MTDAQRERLTALRDSTLKTARARAIKDLATQLWGYQSQAWAEKAWRRWLAWAQRCRLVPMQAAAKTLRRQLWGILNAIVLDLHNGHAESMNSRIQRLKHRACGYRNRERFRSAIYFHRGGLQLYIPEGIRAA